MIQESKTPVAVDGKIYVSVDGHDEQEFEMHSLIKNMLHFWAVNLKYFKGVAVNKTQFNHAISFAYTDSTTYDTDYLSGSTPMSNDFGFDNGNTIIANAVKNADGTKTVTVRKAFTNISGVAKDIASLYLVSSMEYDYLMARDAVSVSVQPNNNFNAKYVITMSKEFTTNTMNLFLSLFNQNTSCISTDNVSANCPLTCAPGGDSISGCGLFVGSSNAPVTGSETVLRSPIPITDLVPSESFNAMYVPLPGSHNGYLKKTRLFSNNTASSITIGEVAHYIKTTSPTVKTYMLMIKAYDSPIEVLPGECVEISVDYALTV